MTAALAHPSPEHIIRFRGRDRWECSCGGFSYGNESAEVHAHATAGRIEMGRAS